MTFDINTYKSRKIEKTNYLMFRDLRWFSEKTAVNINKCLDFGCGAGRSTRFIKSISDSICGYDIDPVAIKIARNNHPDISFFDDKTLLSKTASNFTAIFMVAVLFHSSSKNEIKSTLKYCADILSEKGSIVIVSANDVLYYKDFCSTSPIKKEKPTSGKSYQIKLLDIDMTCQDYYWSFNDVINIAEEIGLSLAGMHRPYGFLNDCYDYNNELLFSPYYYLCLKND